MNRRLLTPQFALSQKGFTLVEILVATGVSAVLLLASLSLIENMQRSKQTSTAKGGLTDARSLIYSALKSPTSCAQVLLPNVASPTAFQPIVSPGVSGNSVPVKILTNSAPGSGTLLADGMKMDGATYSVRLSGILSHTIASSPSHPLNTNVYNGIITVIADRTTIGLGIPGHSQIGAPTVTQNIPVSFEIVSPPANPSSIYACSAVGTDTGLMGATHSINDCEITGGNSVLINGSGRACVFTQINFVVNEAGTLVCNAALNCTTSASPNQCLCSSATVNVPPCPSGPPAGSPPTQTYSGNFYCQYTADPGGICTGDWEPVPAASAPAPSPPNYFCELTASTCPSPGVLEGPPTAPYCEFAAGPSSCPSGSSFIGMSGGQAVCNLLPGDIPAMYANCPSGWAPVPTSPSPIPYNVVANPGPPVQYSAITCQ